MKKLRGPLFSLGATGRLSRAYTLARRLTGPAWLLRGRPDDPKTDAQLSWRTMWQLASELWHQLSPEETAEWERAGTIRGMTGFAWYMSQALRPNPGIYLPLAGGAMTGMLDMNGQHLHGLKGPVHATDGARKKYVDDHIEHLSSFVWNPTYDNILDIFSNDPAVGWTEIDINAIVGDNAKIVILQYRFQVNTCGTAGSSAMALRSAAGGATIYIAVVPHNANDPTERRDIAIIGLTDAQVFEYFISEATAAAGFYIDLNVMGWIE